MPPPLVPTREIFLDLRVFSDVRFYQTELNNYVLGNILNLSPRRFEYLKKLEKQQKKNPASSPVLTYPIGCLTYIY